MKITSLIFNVGFSKMVICYLDIKSVLWELWVYNVMAYADFSMGLLPDTRNCVCACAGDAGNVFPITAGERSRHASRHVRHARAVMHAGIANYRFPLKSAAGENVPSIPGACATCNFTYLVRGPWKGWSSCTLWFMTKMGLDVPNITLQNEFACISSSLTFP